ncbi:MAG: alpha/beta fold hydrolase [Marinobacter sp.]|uniref:alpha/beta fold hydrolase n=1 Tax=Marinobacter sp. TaxID=50741 RepID=UPI00299E8685|nr:alpha/beta fold hydrolase [Marinobacter sp.]MDX1633182.1 alpha/beta fold hydrolase [Marinobacter sp.]
MSVELNYRVTGEGEPLILLHGLFGSLENLGGVSQRLQDGWQIHALDQRNHGRSPHADTMDYPAMAADVLAYMDRQGLGQASLLGHSMGGKVAMELALSHPERVDRLIVADIAPVTYRPRHDNVLAGLDAIDLAALESRQQADEVLRAHVEELPVRQFLLKNLIRVGADEDAGNGARFRWRLNLTAIKACYDNLARAPSAEGPFDGPTLFIKGSESAYIQDKHRDAVARLFPHARLRIIQGAGHWLHAEKADTFATLCRRFLSGQDDGR